MIFLGNNYWEHKTKNFKNKNVYTYFHQRVAQFADLQISVFGVWGFGFLVWDLGFGLGVGGWGLRFGI